MNIEEFVNDYLKKHLDDEFLYSYFGLVEFAKVFQEKLIEEAVEGVLVENVDGTKEVCLHKKRYGDKVKLIVIKEDEK